MRSGGGIPGLDPVHGTAGPEELRAGVRLPGSIGLAASAGDPGK
jgi:hypothetical protein